MNSGISLKKHKTKVEARHKARTLTNQFAYILLGLVFGGMLTLSAMNDFLFFGWLSLCTFIVFSLVGIHMIGINQTRKN